jgi:hypothetical protein
MTAVLGTHSSVLAFSQASAATEKSGMRSGLAIPAQPSRKSSRRLSWASRAVSLIVNPVDSLISTPPNLNLYQYTPPVCKSCSLAGILSVTAFHEKAGRSQVSSFFILLDKGFSPAESATVAMLPSALSRSDSFRSVHVGRSRYNRCCHLLGALWFCSCRVEPRPGD